MRSSPRHVVRLLVLACFLLMVAAVIVCRQPVLEAWHIHHLEDEDWNVRRSAAAELGRLQSTRAIVPLLELWSREFGALFVSEALGPIWRPSSPDDREAERARLRRGRERASDVSKAIEAIGAASIPALVAALGDEGRTDLRHAAASVLRNLGPASSPALARLEKALDDGEFLVRLEALNALDSMGPAGRRALLGALQNGDDSMVFYALERLLVGGVDPSPEVLRAVAGMLRARRPETSPGVFDHVLRLYGSRSPPDGYAGYLLSAMHRGTGRIPEGAAMELCRRRGAPAIPELVDFGLAREEWDPFFACCPEPERGLAGAAPSPAPAPAAWRPEDLGERESEVIEALTRAFDARLINARRAAVHALGRFVPGSTEARRILHASLADPRVREWAGEVVAEIQPAVYENVVPRLRRALQERDSGNFFLATKLAPRLPPERGSVVPVLLEALEVDELSPHALRALKEIAAAPGWEAAAADLIAALDSPRSGHALRFLRPMAPRAVEPLAAAVGHARRSVRLAVLNLLGELGAAAAPAVPALVATLDHADRSTRLGVLEVLGGLGAAGSPALPALIANLDHPDRSTRARTARALGRIGAPARAAVPRLEKAKREDQDHWVRIAATTALELIADAAATED